MELKELFSLLFSLSAILISIATFIHVEMRPFKLMISPPVITLANVEAPSLILDLSFHNAGARPAVVEAIRIHTYSNDKKTSISLYVQQLIKGSVKLAQVALKNESEVENFVTHPIPKNDTWSIRVLAQPYHSQLPLSLNDIMSVNRLSIDVKVNGTWNKKVFL